VAGDKGASPAPPQPLRPGDDLAQLGGGQAGLVVNRTGVGVAPGQAVSTPLFWVCESTRFEDPLEDYIDLWMRGS
jgi:hypothetical protein